MGKQVTLNIKENKYKFFMELVKNLDFIKVEDDQGTEKKEIVNDLKGSLKELKAYKEGRQNLKDAEDLINEL